MCPGVCGAAIPGMIAHPGYSVTALTRSITVLGVA
jgi:hypothetical protein